MAGMCVETTGPSQTEEICRHLNFAVLLVLSGSYNVQLNLYHNDQCIKVACALLVFIRLLTSRFYKLYIIMLLRYLPRKNKKLL